MAVEAADVGAAISRATAAGRSAGQARARRNPRRDGRAGDAALRRHRSLRSPIRRPRPARWRRAVEHGEWLRRSAGTVPEIADIDQCSGDGGGRGARSPDSDEAWLDPATTRRLLAAYGIPLVGERLAATAEEAVAAADEFGYPVVVKTAEAGAHKTETGGVALDLATIRRRAERRPSASVCP